MNFPVWLKLIGIVIVVIGFAFRLRPTLVVVAAALVTGLVSGLPLLSSEGIVAGLPYLTNPGHEGIINMLGRTFVENRFVTLFIVTLPAIGLAERYGLQIRSAALIKRINAATVGRLLIVYQLFRILIGIMGIRLNGHPSFVRPLIFPMSLGAAAMMEGTEPDKLSGDKVEVIKAAGAASENYGNFYGQNLSPVQAGIVLVYSVMAGQGYTVNLWSLVLYTIPIVVLSIVLGFIQFLWLDTRFRPDPGHPS